MHAARRWGFLLLAMVATAAQSAEIPEVLDPWREWVLHGQQERLCPTFAGSDETS